MASYKIGAKLRQQRLSLGLTLDDISRETKIAARFLEAIEKDEFETLPGLVFTRNFVRQFALLVKLDPDSLLTELPVQDESTVRLPDPPARPQSSYSSDQRMRSVFSAAMWVLSAGAAMAAWFHFNHPSQPRTENSAQVAATNTPEPAAAPVETKVSTGRSERADNRVQVVITAHQPAWLAVSVDGKPAFTGTLQADETKELGAEGQVKIVTGNAGALTILLNGKTLEPLGPVGQVRTVRLTAGGPEFLSRGPQPAPDPL